MEIRQLDSILKNSLPSIQKGVPPQKLGHNDIRWITVNEIKQHVSCLENMEYVWRRLIACGRKR